MICPKCGCGYADGAGSCPVCGTKTDAGMQSGNNMMGNSSGNNGNASNTPVYNQPGQYGNPAPSNYNNPQQNMPVQPMNHTSPVNTYPNQQGYGPAPRVNPPSGGTGIRCPKCGGMNCQIINETFTKGKDYGAGKGCLGFLCFGPIGLICGACGKGKQMNTNNFSYCPDCGNKFKI